MYTYLLLNIATIFFPFVLSFDKKVAFYKKWHALLPAILIPGTIFIIWDIWFTRIGIWEFNPDFLSGIYIVNLPLEEWLFFLTVPYACVFIYACLIAYFPKDVLQSASKWINRALILFLLLIGTWAFPRYYTSVTFFSLAIFVGVLEFGTKAKFLGRFYSSYLVSLIPFLIVNGVLTALPVVIYNDLENLSIRIGTIPVEDTMYMMLLLMMNVAVFEFFLSRKKQAFQLKHSEKLPT